MGEWIRCSDRMPGDDESVLVVFVQHGMRTVEIADWDSEDELWWLRFNSYTRRENVTHWQPPPPLPETNDDEGEAE